MHPCYSDGHSQNIARIHLPVAPKCNLGCGFCERRDGENSQVLDFDQAIEALEQYYRNRSNLKIVGVAGPGEPLLSNVTFKVLQYVKRNYPGLSTCLCTNGIEVVNKLQEIKKTCDYFTVTINAISVDTAKQLYKFVDINGNRSQSDNAIAEYISLIWSGLEKLGQLASLKGLKVNTVLIPGINDHEVAAIAKRAADYGVREHNIKPLVPRGIFKNTPAPTAQQLYQARIEASQWISVFHHCKNCRPDACGVPGKDDISLLRQLGA